MSELAATQRWMRQVIGDVDGVDAGLARAAAAPPGGVVHGSAGLSARERLALYNRARERRLVGCLRECYPALRYALGDGLFDDFAREYLGARPSRSYTLATLGAAWPDHLEATRPDGDLPPREREAWPDFLVDLARLERTFLEVYDGPGPERGPRLAMADLPADLERSPAWEAIAVTVVAGLRLVEARCDVAAYVVAVRAGEKPALPGPGPSFLALGRRDWVVVITHLTAAEHALLAGLAAGRRLAAAARAAGLERSAACAALRDWADRGLLAASHIHQSDPPVSPSTRGVVSQ